MYVCRLSDILLTVLASGAIIDPDWVCSAIKEYYGQSGGFRSLTILLRMSLSDYDYITSRVAMTGLERWCLFFFFVS